MPAQLDMQTALVHTDAARLTKTAPLAPWSICHQHVLLDLAGHLQHQHQGAAHHLSYSAQISV